MSGFQVNPSAFRPGAGRGTPADRGRASDAVPAIDGQSLAQVARPGRAAPMSGAARAAMVERRRKGRRLRPDEVESFAL